MGLTALSQAVLNALNYTKPAKISTSNAKSLMNKTTNTSNISNNTSGKSSIWTTSGVIGLLGALFVSSFLIAQKTNNIQVNNQKRQTEINQVQ